MRKTKRKVLQGDDSAQARIKPTGGESTVCEYFHDDGKEQSVSLRNLAPCPDAQSPAYVQYSQDRPVAMFQSLGVQHFRRDKMFVLLKVQKIFSGNNNIWCSKILERQCPRVPIPVAEGFSQDQILQLENQTLPSIEAACDAGTEA